jgi:curli biogenesis system outer membrane secretion channel CsgG
LKTNLTILILLSILLSCSPFQPYGQQTERVSQSTPGRSAQTRQATNISPMQELTTAIRSISNYLNDNIPEGNRIAILYVQSDSPSLSQFVFDDLSQNVVNDRRFTVVERHLLDKIRDEQNFHLSGFVNDSTALGIGGDLGAQTIVLGQISSFGGHYRINIRALDVETTTVQGQTIQNLGTNRAINSIIRG